MTTQSSQPRKQRRAQADPPHHQRQKRLRAHLAEDLLIRYDRRSLTVREDDTVELMRGSHKGTEGKVMGVDPSRGLLTVEGVTVTKADGTERPKWIRPSNVRLTKIDLSDPLRRDHLGRKAEQAWEDQQEEERQAALEEALDHEEEPDDAPTGTEGLDDALEGAPEEGPGAADDQEEEEGPTEATPAGSAPGGEEE